MTVEQPVWSEYISPSSTTVVNKIYVSTFPGYIVVGVGICVDPVFFLACFKCPFSVTTDFDNYVRNCLDVNPVRDFKNPVSMAHIHVNSTG